MGTTKKTYDNDDDVFQFFYFLLQFQTRGDCRLAERFVRVEPGVIHMVEPVDMAVGIDIDSEGGYKTQMG